MRKLAIATFVLLYPMLILSASSARYNDWASSLGHCNSGQHCPPSTTIEKAETHLSQGKIFENGFLMELPQGAVHATAHPNRLILLPSPEYRATWSSQPFSSRAPPFLI